MRLSEFRITRFQFSRDRVIGDSQVRADTVNVAALELVAEDGNTGLGFIQSLFHPLPAQDELVRVFEDEAWPALVGQYPAGLVHRVDRPRGGNQRSFSQPFKEALQVALWDLAAKQAGLPLHAYLGSRRDRVRAYASGLDYHLSRQRVRGALCARRRPGIHGLQDQGRPPRLRPRPRPPEAARQDRAQGRQDHDRRQRGVGPQGSGDEAERHPERRLRPALGRGSDPARRLRRHAHAARRSALDPAELGRISRRRRQAAAAPCRRRGPAQRPRLRHRRHADRLAGRRHGRSR